MGRKPLTALQREWLQSLRQTPAHGASDTLKWLKRRGLVKCDGSRWTITEKGRSAIEAEAP